jgi:hypothetical protein
MRSDDYETPDTVWDAILHYIDNSKVIWEPFYSTGRAGRYLQNKGFAVFHRPLDFFTYTPREFDVVLSNPPFAIKALVFERLLLLNKPFAMLLPLQSLAHLFFREAFADTARRDKLQLLFMAHRVNFLLQGEPAANKNKQASFDSVWVCYDLKLPHFMNYENDVTGEPLLKRRRLLHEREYTFRPRKT